MLNGLSALEGTDRPPPLALVLQFPLLPPWSPGPGSLDEKGQKVETRHFYLLNS
jgi:hypothetical protein